MEEIREKSNHFSEKHLRPIRLKMRAAPEKNDARLAKDEHETYNPYPDRRCTIDCLGNL